MWSGGCRDEGFDAFGLGLDEACGEGVGRRRAELLEGAAGFDAALSEEDDVVGCEVGGFGEVVCDEDDGFVEPLEEVAELVLEFGADEWVEGAERFVEEEDFGVEDEGAHEGDALSLAAGELAWELAEHVGGEVDHVGEFVDAVLDVGSRPAGAFGGESDVVEGGEVWEESAGLDGVAEALSEGAEVGGGEVLSVDEDAAGGWFDESDEESEEGGLAAAGGSDECAGGGALDVDGDAVEGEVWAEAFVGADDGEHGGSVGEGGKTEAHERR